MYLDGVFAGDAASKYKGQDIDLKLTNHTTYEIGFKKDTKEVLHGSLRDLAVFLRPLSQGEVFTLYSKLVYEVLRPALNDHFCSLNAECLGKRA